MPFLRTTSCCSATRNTGSEARRRCQSWRMPHAAAIRSIGQDRMVAGLVAARRTFQISSDQPACISSTRARPRYPRRFQRLRGRQHARGSDRPGLPRAGGTGCLRDLVVQSRAAAGSRPSTSSTIPTSAICGASLPTPDAGSGCSTSPAISAFRASSRSRIRCENGQDYHRVRFRLALRCAHRAAAGAHRAEPVSVHRSHGRRHREKMSLDGTPLRIKDHSYLSPSDTPLLQPDLDISNTYCSCRVPGSITYCLMTWKPMCSMAGR